MPASQVVIHGPWVAPGGAVLAKGKAGFKPVRPGKGEPEERGRCHPPREACACVAAAPCS